MDNVGLDDQVVVNEFGWIGVVGVDAADLGCCQKDVVGAFGFEKGPDCGLIHKIEAFKSNAALRFWAEIRSCSVDGAENVLEALDQQCADYGAADHTGGTGYENLVCLFHLLFF